MPPEPVCNQIKVLPPWVDNLFRLISWYDMNKFSAHLFVNISASLVEIEKWAPGSDQWTADSVERFGFRVANDLRKIGCLISAEAARRFAMDFSISKWSPEVKQSRAHELKDTIFSEMEQHLFFWVPPERARYFEYPEAESDWNDAEKIIEGQIRPRFLRAATEINAARKCYSVAQWTPCVFHLMRASEAGIKAIFRTLDVSSPNLSDSWGELLKPMDKQLSLPVRDRHGDWASSPEFFYHAVNDTRAIKRAWRDPTMHIESDYDEAGALKALDAVTGFFSTLATKLDQDGKFYP